MFIVHEKVCGLPFAVTVTMVKPVMEAADLKGVCSVCKTERTPLYFYVFILLSFPIFKGFDMFLCTVSPEFSAKVIKGYFELGHLIVSGSKSEPKTVLFSFDS